MLRPRAFRLSEPTLQNLDLVAKLAGTSPSRVIDVLVSELMAYGPEKVDWTRFQPHKDD